jgi:hypothetical protein
MHQRGVAPMPFELMVLDTALDVISRLVDSILTYVIYKLTIAQITKTRWYVQLQKSIFEYNK